jgi:serine/threonine protein phosphatase PrpC
MDTDSERIRFEFGFACDIGCKRKGEPNQDAVEVVLPNANEPWHPPLLLVADGLGRYYGGTLASQTVVNVFKRIFKESQHPTEYPALMERCVQAAHQEVRLQGAKDVKLALMGSTIVAAVLDEQRLFVLNVGDSRAYILGDGKVRQVSHDQSWAAAQVQAGILTEAEARAHPNRNRLTMAITAKRTKIESYSAEEKLEPHDVVLLCSDGLWGVVPESLIRAAATELAPQVAADKLVALANNSEGPDNISVIIASRTGSARKANIINLEDTHA